MAYVIAEPCIDVKDRACVDECPVDCIYEGPRMLYIQPDECVDCDACVPVCPVTAIFPDDSVTGLGSPGGAAQAGPAAVDHPIVANWQPA
jgi:NAD-dependent dihydropyrimidine dehydrogenase PreA subunit